MSHQPQLQVAIKHRIGVLTLDLAFTVAHAWNVLFAPSGAGKSTILRIVAGLTRPNAGRIVWTSPAGDPHILTDTASRIFVPPHRRVIRFVTQHQALFPHRTVLENIHYGVSHASQQRAQSVASPEPVDAILKLCRIHHLASRMPAMLSGGERQRVAIARVIAATGCRVLLLDEPFSALDIAMRRDLLADLKPWLTQRNILVLHVTHDIGEVLALNAEVLKMHAGQILAQGPASQVLQQEKLWLEQQLWSAPPSGSI